MAIDYEYIRNVGIGAAYGSAKILCDHLGNLDRIEKKGPGDLVTSADLASEKQIMDTIHARFPDHDFLAEESGETHRNISECCWIIDPLDGTTNYAHQVPLFAISIAFAVSGETQVGIVLNPVTGELFTAIRGKGATLNGRPIRTSSCPKLSDALLVTGFPYNAKQNIKPYMTRFERCLNASIGVRRLGSAALDLCFVACGRFDGFWEENLKPWDTAAGDLIAKEAGARVTDFTGNEYTVDKNEILATNGHIHDNMCAILQHMRCYEIVCQK